MEIALQVNGSRCAIGIIVPIAATEAELEAIALANARDSGIHRREDDSQSRRRRK